MAAYYYTSNGSLKVKVGDSWQEVRVYPMVSGSLPTVKVIKPEKTQRGKKGRKG